MSMTVTVSPVFLMIADHESPGALSLSLAESADCLRRLLVRFLAFNRGPMLRRIETQGPGSAKRGFTGAPQRTVGSQNGAA